MDCCQEAMKKEAKCSVDDLALAVTPPSCRAALITLAGRQLSRQCLDFLAIGRQDDGQAAPSGALVDLDLDLYTGRP
jgi:hypothetical protein